MCNKRTLAEQLDAAQSGEQWCRILTSALSGAQPEPPTCDGMADLPVVDDDSDVEGDR